MDREKKIQEIARLEKELLSANPRKASKITVKIVKRRGQVFDET